MNLIMKKGTEKWGKTSLPFEFFIWGNSRWTLQGAREKIKKEQGDRSKIRREQGARTPLVSLSSTHIFWTSDGIQFDPCFQCRD